MFEKRTFVALGLLVLVSGAAVYSLTLPDPHKRRDGDRSERKDVPTFSIEQVDGLQISEQGKDTVVLERDKNGVWQMKRPIVSAADKNNVKQALDALTKMRFKDVIAESESSHKTLQVLPEQVVTVVVEGGGQRLATMHVGRTGNTRLGDSKNVWSVLGLNRFILARDIRLWRDREIVRFESSSVVKLDLVYADGRQVSFAKTDNKDEKSPVEWTVKAGQTYVGGAPDSQQVTSAISMLSRLDATDFPKKTDADSTGLGTPRLKVIARLADGKAHEIWIGKQADAGVYARREGGARVWLINKSTADSLFKSPPQWRDKTIVKIPATDVRRITIKKGATSIVLALQEDKSWKSVGPTPVPKLDPGKVQVVARALQNLRAQSIVADPDKADMRPTGSLTLTTSDGKSTTLIVGPAVEKEYRVKLAGKKDVFLVNKYYIDSFLLGPADFEPKPTASR